MRCLPKEEGKYIRSAFAVDDTPSLLLRILTLLQRKCCHTFAERDIKSNQASCNPPEPDISVESEGISQSEHVDSVRFVGELNPESVLSDLGERPKGSLRQSRVGVWIEARGDEGQGLPSTAEDRVPLLSFPSRSGASRLAPRHPALLRFLQDTGAFAILPLASQRPLIDLYFSHVHPFLPLIDAESFFLRFQKGQASNFLILAICLTASKSAEAARSLRWDTEGPVVAPRIFAKRLYDGLHFAISTGQETDPLTNIQILGLLALHNDGPQGLENASMHLSQAIHHAHTLGLHIDSSRTFPQNGHTERMFWSLWCLDKLLACMAGRPVKIFDEDIGITRPEYLQDSRQAVFYDHLALCDLLSSIIHFYRPTTDQDCSGWEEDFPKLEETTNRRSNLHTTELSE
jgi:Fungal specific transcription factor domain